MALTLFTDTLAKLEDIDILMNYHVAYQSLDTPQRENAIKAASKLIDNQTYWGIKIDQGQPMKFPRTFRAFVVDFDQGDDVFDSDNVERKLQNAVAHQVEFELNRVGIGATTFSRGRQSAQIRQDMLCRESMQTLAPYIKS